VTADYLSTLRQTVPQLVTVLKSMDPTLHVRDVSRLDATFFQDRNIEGVIWDVDGTLMGYHAMDVDPEFRDMIRRQFRDGPVHHAILSNSDEARFQTLGTIFPEIPVLRGYATPNGPVRRSLFQGRDTHTPEEIGEILKHGHQIRKPNADLIRFAMTEMGLEDPAKVVMIGDQYLTDIASANLAGVQSIKVDTYRRDTFPFSLRCSQRAEKMLYLFFKRRRS
jgi:HAD superfamily phosphatase (TIGR01668 family)